MGSFMSRLSRKSKITAAVAIVIALFASGTAAYAYWTGTGSGSATATAAAGGSVTIAGTTATGLAPGTSKTVTFTATNATEAAIKIGTVSDTAIDSNLPACDAQIADFSMADVVADQIIPANTVNHPVTATGSLVYAYSPTVNQDACKGAVITLTLTATAGA
jgi:hypothetical protein